ncbi:MAG: HDIG domain-containing metalloprotein, partial [Deltaproteobacteria bacterium]
MAEDPLPPRWPGLGRLVSKAAALLIWLGVSAGAGALLTQGLLAPSIPYDASSLGQISAVTVKAPRDYDLPDEESSRRKREAAAAEVRPVYDLDPSALAEVDSRVHDAFTSLRAALASAPAPAPKATLPKDELEPLRQALVSKLQTPVETRDLEALLKEGFSAEAEQAVLDLVGREMTRMLVGDRELLVAERRGVFVRPLPEGAPGGEVVTDLDSIKDLAAARGDVERAALDLPFDAPNAVRRALAHLAQGALRPNLTYDSAETERRRLDAYRDVAPVVIQLKRGEKVIGVGERIEPRHLLAFQAIRDRGRTGGQSLARLAAALLSGLLILVVYRFGRHGLRRFQPRRKDALFLGLLLLGSLAALTGLGALGGVLADRFPRLSPDAITYALPFAAGALLVRLVLPAEIALVFALVSSALYGLLEGASLTFAIYALAGSLIGADQAARSRDRSGLLRAGLLIGLTNACVIGCFEAFVGRLWSLPVAEELALGFLGGALFCPMLALALAPLVEAVFGYTTDARLLELASLNHPALKELIVKAPGTYHHSIILGALAEAAAEAIGANPLLARVSAYYHDLGKGKSPLTFAENQKGQNRHDALPPEESAALI